MAKKSELDKILDGVSSINFNNINFNIFKQYKAQIATKALSTATVIIKGALKGFL